MDSNSPGKPHYKKRGWIKLFEQGTDVCEVYSKHTPYTSIQSFPRLPK